MLHLLIAPLVLAPHFLETGPQGSMPRASQISTEPEAAARQPRELSADRPDTTESPFTVERGRVQLEASLADWSRDDGEDTTTAVAANVKFGLSAATDLQLVFDSYAWHDADDGAEDSQGFGDVQLRFKWNLWGNDGGVDALALMPYVKIPTETDLSNGEWEGGLIVPYARDLGERFGLGLMAELDLVADDDGELETELLYSAVLGFDVTARSGAFVEYVGVLREEGDPALASIGTTYEVHADLMLDAGLRIGLNDDAEGLGIFVGLTARY